jgi:hypothetical protein
MPSPKLTCYGILFLKRTPERKRKPNLARKRENVD